MRYVQTTLYLFRFLIALCLVFSFNKSFGQDNLPDSNVRFLELSTRLPQPRLGEYTSVGVDLNPLRKSLLSTLTVRMKLSNNITEVYSDPYSLLDLKPTKTGWYEIGPFEFSVNNIKYKTNKLAYQVIDSLPAIDKGLWIRNVKTAIPHLVLLWNKECRFQKKLHFHNGNMAILQIINWLSFILTNMTIVFY